MWERKKVARDVEGDVNNAKSLMNNFFKKQFKSNVTKLFKTQESRMGYMSQQICITS